MPNVGVGNPAETSVDRARRLRRTVFAWCLVPLAALAAGSEASAQAPEIPPSAEPGLLERQFERPAEPRSTLEEEEPLPELPAGEAEAVEEVRFLLRGVVVEGATVYDEADFRPLFAEYLGREVTLTEIRGVAAALTAKYRDDGYILSRAIVPPQAITEGIVRIRVIEGFIDRIIIDGEIEGPESLLRAYGRKIAASRPLHSDDLERYLLLIDDLPGVAVRSVLAPSEVTTGAADLLVTLTHDPAEAFATLDNRGTRFIGPWLGSAGFRVNSLIGEYEGTTGRVVVSTKPRELRFYEGVHEEQLGAEGTKVTLEGSLSFSRPGFRLRDAKIRSVNKSVSAGISHPFVRSRRENLAAEAGFEVRNARTRILDDVLSEDQLRILRAGGTYDFVDPLLGINLFGFQVHQGLDFEFLNARKSGSPDLSREDGRSDFTKLTFDVSRLQRLFPGVNIVGAATGQYAPMKLLASEEFGLGGRRFGRAYDPFEITGDHGAAASVELQLGGSEGTDSAVFDHLSLFVFYDYGRIWRYDPGADQESESLSSLGFGLRFRALDALTGSLEVDAPLTRRVGARDREEASDPRFFLSLGLGL